MSATDSAVPVVYEPSAVSVVPAQRSPLYHLRLDQLEGFAQRAARSSLFTGVNTPEKALMRLAAGQARGLDPVASLSLVYILGGVPRLHASAIAGLIKASGRYRYTILQRDDERCELAWQERVDGAWVNVGTSAFSMSDARTARLVRPDSGWVTWPRRMLFARALTEGAGVYAPEIVIGLGAIENYDGDNAQPDATQVAAAAAAQALGGGLEPAPSPPPPEPQPDPEPEAAPQTPPEPEPESAPATEPATPPQDAPEPAEAESLYAAIDRQRQAFTPDELAAFVTWAQSRGIERPTVQTVMDTFGEAARDLARLMRTSEPTHVQEAAAESLTQTPEQRASAQGFHDEYATPEPVQTEMLDERMQRMRASWDALPMPDRSDLQALLVDAGVVASIQDATPDVVAMMAPPIEPTIPGLYGLRDSLGALAGSDPQQTL